MEDSNPGKVIEKKSGFWYQFYQRRYPPWLYLILILAYSGGLYLVIRMIYTSRL